MLAHILRGGNDHSGKTENELVEKSLRSGSDMANG